MMLYKKTTFTLVTTTLLLGSSLSSLASFILPSDLGFGIDDAGDKITGRFDISAVTGIPGCEVFLGTDGPFVNSTGTGWVLGVDMSNLSDNFSLHVNSADADIRITLGAILDPEEVIISSIPLVGTNPNPSVFAITAISGTGVRIENTTTSTADWGSPIVLQGSDPSSIFPGDWVRADFAALVSANPNNTSTPVSIEIIKPVPEPSSSLLSLLGLGSLLLNRKR